MEPKVDIAKVDEIDIGFEDHGFFIMFGGFTYDRGGAQGMGYDVDVDLEFIQKFIKACGVNTLRECEGRIVRVTHTKGEILKIEPLFGEGETFDVKEWQKKGEEECERGKG